MDCELKLKKKADELKKEYQNKLVDMQRSYNNELNAIKHVFNSKLCNSIVTLDSNYKVTTFKKLR